MADSQVEELLREAKRARRVDLERIELFELLVKSAGWEAYVDILNSKIQGLADQVMRPAGSVDGAVELEYVKGAMSGLIIARDLPSVTIAAKADLRQPVREIEDVDSDAE